MLRAVRHLKRADPVWVRLIERVGPCRFEAVSDIGYFEYLLHAIIHQQLSGKAAATITGRFQALFGGRMPTPPELLAAPDEGLRGAGLSRGKVRYVKDLATRVESGALPIGSLDTMPDEDVVTALVQVTGIGRWTADMVLIFRLGRPDVLPTLDLGIRKAVQRGWSLRRLPSPQRVAELGAGWAPYRSIATWYLWRSLDAEGNPPQKRRKKPATPRKATPKAPARTRRR
jgi:DNA-3-methyladenine glycosylase II